MWRLAWPLPLLSVLAVGWVAWSAAEWLIALAAKRSVLARRVDGDERAADRGDIAELLARAGACRVRVEAPGAQLSLALGEVIGELVVHVARHVGAPERAFRAVGGAGHGRLPPRAWRTRDTAPEKRRHSVDSAVSRCRPAAVSS